MWRNDDCPCTQDCPERDRYCHGVCERYKKWAKKREDDKKAHAIQMEGIAMTYSHKHRNWARAKSDRSGAKKKFEQ